MFQKLLILPAPRAPYCPTAFISVGGHSVSFIPEEILRHAAGAVDCVLIGEGETAITSLLDAARQRSGEPEGGAWLRNTRSSRAAANLREIAG